MKPITVTCPKCRTDISIDEVLSHQIEEEIKSKYDSKWEEEKRKLWKIAQEKAAEKLTKIQNEELKTLKDQIEEKDKKLAEARELELTIRKQKNELEDQKKAFELEKQRQLDAEREKIRQETATLLLEEHRHKDAEKDKKMADMKKTIEELQLKANLTSQQLQGEILELELENILKSEFPVDDILPVAKGVEGADILQKVKDLRGRICGTIVWESKRTKTWGGDWIQKLKDNTLKVKGDVAVLVSIVLPKGIKNFGHKEGIYVANFDNFLGLAILLRKTLIDHQIIKSSVVGKNEKMEMVYSYFLSSEFRQRVEAIAQAFSSMKEDLENEKRVFQKLWAKREKEIERVINNTAAMHGDLQGLMGESLPEVKSLEAESLLVGIDEKDGQNVLFNPTEPVNS